MAKSTASFLFLGSGREDGFIHLFLHLPSVPMHKRQSLCGKESENLREEASKVERRVDASRYCMCLECLNLLKTSPEYKGLKP